MARTTDIGRAPQSSAPNGEPLGFSGEHISPHRSLFCQCKLRFKHSTEPGQSDRATAQPRNGEGSSQATGTGDNSNREGPRRITSRWRALRRRDLELLDWDHPAELSRRFSLSRYGPRGRPFGDYMVSA